MKTSSTLINPLRRTLGWTSLLLSTVHGTNDMLDSQKLERALNGELPLYMISVTRSTLSNSEDEYKSLQDSQIYLVMSVVKAVLGQPVGQDEFQQTILKKIDSEIAEYERISANPSSDRLSKIEKQLLEYGDLNYANLNDSKKSLIITDYSNLHEKIKQDMSYLDFTQIPSNIGFVAFNEMFFGKSVAFQKEKMENLFQDVTNNFENKIFFVNLLVNSSIVGDQLNHFKEKIRQSFHAINMDAKNNLPDMNGNFSYESDIFNLYKKNINGLDSLEKINVLENISYTYHQGVHLTYYNKSSYFQENDHDLERGYFYLMGDKEDYPIKDVLEENKDTIKKLQEILLNRVATEICRDLVVGVRKNKPKQTLTQPSSSSSQTTVLKAEETRSTYPRDLKLHLVPSNTIRFNDDIRKIYPNTMELYGMWILKKI